MLRGNSPAIRIENGNADPSHTGMNPMLMLAV
jgi:hypothetical protein